MDTDSRPVRIAFATLIGGMVMSMVLSGPSIIDLLGGKISNTASVFLQMGGNMPARSDALMVNPLLQMAAEAKARDMAEKGYFSHTGPDGKTPVIWVREAEYDFDMLKEEISIQTNGESSNEWFTSAEFRNHILNGNFTEIGSGSADGYFNGKPATFFVHFFARSK